MAIPRFIVNELKFIESLDLVAPQNSLMKNSPKASLSLLAFVSFVFFLWLFRYIAPEVSISSDGIMNSKTDDWVERDAKIVKDLLLKAQSRREFDQILENHDRPAPDGVKSITLDDANRYIRKISDVKAELRLFRENLPD